MVVEARDGSVADARSAPKYGFRVELIRHAETRTESERVGLRETAIAAPRPVAFIHKRAIDVIYSWVRRIGPEFHPAVVDFMAVAFEIPADAVIERELARDFPRVLKVDTPSLPAQLRVLNRVYGT